jgi:hypothetical protein
MRATEVRKLLVSALLESTVAAGRFWNPEVIAQHVLGDQPVPPGVKIARVRQRMVLSVMRLKPANGGD